MLFSGLTLDLDVTYILVLALFLLPLLVLNGLIYKPFLKLFEERHEQLQGALERAENRLDEAESKARAFEAKIQVATARGIEARNQIRAEAQKAMAVRIDEERKKLAKKLETALAEVERARAEGLSEVARESKILGELTATKLLGRGI